MSKSNTWENDLLKLLFNNTDAGLIGDATGLRGSSTAGSLYVGLHTGDPGETGDQTTNEASYGSYARVGVARTGGAWIVSNNEVSPASAISFPECSSGTATISHFSVGTAASGTGKLLYKGTVTPNIAVATTVVPVLSTATKITED